MNKHIEFILNYEQKLPFNNNFNLHKKNLERNIIPNYSLIDGYKQVKINDYDKTQIYAREANKNINIERIIKSENPSDYYINRIKNEEDKIDTKIQKIVERSNYNPTTLNLEDDIIIDLTDEINGGSIFSSIANIAKSILPTILNAGKNIIKNPNVIKDVVKTGKEVVDIIKPKKENNIEIIDPQMELINLFKEGKISAEQFSNLFSDTKIKKNKKINGSGEIIDTYRGNDYIMTSQEKKRIYKSIIKDLIY